MTAVDYADLIDRLGAAAKDCREVIHEAHAATKDLRAAIKEAREAAAGVRGAAEESVGELLKAEAARQIEEMGETVRRKMDEASKHVISEFDRLANLCLTGMPDGRGKDVFAEIAERNGRTLKALR